MRTAFKMAGIPILILASLAGAVGGLLSVDVAIPSEARMAAVDVGVFWDITCTQNVTNVDWGTCEPQQNKTLTLYVKNTGESPITGSLNTSQWIPEQAADYISLDWDFGFEPLQAGMVRETDFILMVSCNITGVEEFYFLITVTGTQYLE